MDGTQPGVAGQRVTVFLLDDHEVVRRGVKDLLEAEPGIEVVGEAGTCARALARIPALRPTVALLDVRLPDGDGVTVCRTRRHDRGAGVRHGPARQVSAAVRSRGRGGRRRAGPSGP